MKIKKTVSRITHRYGSVWMLNTIGDYAADLWILPSLQQ